DLEAVLLEDAREVALRLELLEAEFREREQVVDDLLDELGAAFDAREGLGLETLDAGGVGRGLGAERGAAERDRGDDCHGAAKQTGHQRLLGGVRLLRLRRNAAWG